MGITVTDHYTVQENLSFTGDTYRLDWIVTQSDQLFDQGDCDTEHTYSQGNSIFAPDGKGGTNVTYTNLASPHSRPFITWANDLVYNTTYAIVKVGVTETLNQIASGVQSKVEQLEAAIQN
jgi:hypothetical protein